MLLAVCQRIDLQKPGKIPFKHHKIDKLLPFTNELIQHLLHGIEVILLRHQKGIGVLGKTCKKKGYLPRPLRRKVIESHNFRIGFDQLLTMGLD